MGGGEGSAGARNRNVFTRASMIPRCRTGRLGLLPPTLGRVAQLQTLEVLSLSGAHSRHLQRARLQTLPRGRLPGNCAANGRHVAIRLNSANNRQLIEILESSNALT